MTLRSLLLKVGRSDVFKRAAGNLLVWGHRLLPVQTVAETKTWLAFRHPQPTYPIHFLLTPRVAVKEMIDLPVDTWLGLPDIVQDVVEKHGLQTSGYRLICNAGAYQDFPLLHFHLVSGE